MTPVNQLALGGSSLRGPVAGKLISCALRPGVSVPPGSYMLLPAVDDPIYGTFVMMVPVSESPTGSGAYFGTIKDASDPQAQASIRRETPALAYGKQVLPAPAEAGLRRVSSQQEALQSELVFSKSHKTKAVPPTRYIKEPPGEASASIKMNQPASIKVNEPASMKFNQPASAKANQPADAMAGIKVETASVQNPTFVLSTKQVPGRNNIIVSFGFSDLVEALRSGSSVVVVG